GEVSPPSRSLTGPAPPRRSVCAPDTMLVSFYRRPPPSRSTLMQLFSWLRQQKTRQPQNRRSPARRPAPGFRPRLEALEDRSLPSTLTVVNNLDSGAGSLRGEIAAANPGDQIVFATSVHVITLTSGELAVNKNLDIEGPGAAKLTVSGNNASRVF